MITKAQLDEMLKNKHVTVEVPIKMDIPKWNPSGALSFLVPGMPIPVPRQTQRDKWMKRPCVMKYREYADRLRAFINLNDMYVGSVTMKFYLPTKKANLIGKPHRVKPDWDNLAKGVQDALLNNDSMIWKASVEKYWCVIGMERTELTFTL